MRLFEASQQKWIRFVFPMVAYLGCYSLAHTQGTFHENAYNTIMFEENDAGYVPAVQRKHAFRASNMMD